MGRLCRWTLQEHPDTFWTAITLNTILAVGLGFIAAAIMIWMFLACVLTPTNRTTAEKLASPVTALAEHEPQTNAAHTAETPSTDAAGRAVSNASADHERIQGSDRQRTQSEERASDVFAR